MPADTADAERLVELAAKRECYPESVSWVSASDLAFLFSEIARQRALLDEREAEVAKWQTAERALGAAYLRLRALIPGAYDTPHAPSAETVWAHTEDCLNTLALKCETLEAEAARLRAALAAAEATIAVYPKTTAEVDQMEQDAFLRGRNVGEKYAAEKWAAPQVAQSAREAALREAAELVEEASKAPKDWTWGRLKTAIRSLIAKPGASP